MIALGILLLIASSFGLGVLVTLWVMDGLREDDLNAYAPPLYAGATYSVDRMTYPATDDVDRPYESTLYPFHRAPITDDDAGNALDPKHG